MSPLEKLFDRLSNGWETAESLCKEFGWQPHSLRGRISNVSAKFKVAVERQRVDGVTSYRIAPKTPHDTVHKPEATTAHRSMT